MHHQALMWRGPCNVSEMEAVAWYSCRSWPLVWVTVPLIHYEVSCFNRYLAKVGTVDSSLVSRSRFKKNAPARRFSFAYSALHSHFTATPSARHAAVRRWHLRFSTAMPKCLTPSAYDHDVVIVGASFAGAACALAAAQYGLRVCVLERKADPGERLHTTGIVVKEAMEQTGWGACPSTSCNASQTCACMRRTCAACCWPRRAITSSPPIRRT